MFLANVTLIAFIGTISTIFPLYSFLDIPDKLRSFTYAIPQLTLAFWLITVSIKNKDKDNLKKMNIAAICSALIILVMRGYYILADSFESLRYIFSYKLLNFVYDIGYIGVIFFLYCIYRGVKNKRLEILIIINIIIKIILLVLNNLNNYLFYYTFTNVINFIYIIEGISFAVLLLYIYILVKEDGILKITEDKESIKINLEKNGILKEAPVGFSWTTFFFGFLPALIRGDIKWGVVMLAGSVFTSGISSLVFPFIYNKLYIKSLIENGYIPKTEEDIDLLNQMDIRYQKEGKQKSEASIMSSEKENNTIHRADELKKWMELFKDGSITKEEYDSIKAKILQNN